MGMNWFYESNDQPAGPVAESQLEDLLRIGTITPETLVWHEGMADWRPLHTARPSASAPESAGPPRLVDVQPSAVCTECGQMFLQGDMVFLNQSWVCAHCKPRFLQRMMEGGAPRAATGLLWRSNRQFVMSHNTPLPDRCVCCNEPADGFKLKRQLHWHPPAYYLLILISVLVYLIVALIVRKGSTLHIGLCERHRTARKWNILGSWLAVIVGGIMLGLAASYDSSWTALAGVVVLLGGAVYGLAKAPVISAAKIDGDFVWVKGAGPSFLATLPEWSGPR